MPSYACGGPWPGCRCSKDGDGNGNATILGEERDLEIAYFLAAMDQAEIENAARNQAGWRSE